MYNIYKTYWKIILCLFFTSKSLNAGGKNATDYGSEFFVTVGKICSLSYGAGSPFREELTEQGWEFYPLYPMDSCILEKNDIIGVLGINGPLNVISYAGTRNFQTTLIDLDITRVQLSKLFPRLPHDMHVHTGFLNYYSMLDKSRASYLYNNHDPDELFILAGHSLGGACAQLGAIDIFNNSPAEYLENNNLTTITFGSPPLFNSEAASLMDNILPYKCNLRFAYEDDLFVNWTRSKTSHELWPYHRKTSSQEVGFVHAGYEWELSSNFNYLSVIRSHFLDNYINAKYYGCDGYLSTAEMKDYFTRRTLCACEQLISIEEEFCEKIKPDKEVKLHHLEDNISLIDKFFLRPQNIISTVQKNLVAFQPSTQCILTLQSLFATFDEVCEYLNYRDKILEGISSSTYRGIEYEGDLISKVLFNHIKNFQFKLSRLPRNKRLNVYKNIIIGIAETLYSISPEDFLRPENKALEEDNYLRFFSIKNLNHHLKSFEQMPFSTLTKSPEKSLREYQKYFQEKRDNKRERLWVAKMVDYDPKRFETKIIQSLMEEALNFSNSNSAYSLLPLIIPTRAFENFSWFLKHFNYNDNDFKQALEKVEKRISEEKELNRNYLYILNEMLNYDTEEYRSFAKSLLTKIDKKI